MGPSSAIILLLQISKWKLYKALSACKACEFTPVDIDYTILAVEDLQTLTAFKRNIILIQAASRYNINGNRGYIWLDFKDPDA